MLLLVILAATFPSIVLGVPQSNGNILSHRGRIVGGTTVNISNYSYQVSLLRRNRHYCGGAILSPSWILTAAHCVVGGLISSYSIRAGSSSSNSGGQLIAASRILYHARYKRPTLDYDIALVQLVSPITIRNARSISLVPSGTGPATGAIATITGWGVLIEGGPLSATLQAVQVPTVSQTSCRAAYSGAFVTDRMFCAGILGVGGRDSCHGDSGGPVVIGGALAGLVSWGFDCASPRYPGVYVNLYYFRNWIDYIISRH